MRINLRRAVSKNTPRGSEDEEDEEEDKANKIYIPLVYSKCGAPSIRETKMIVIR